MFQQNPTGAINGYKCIGDKTAIIANCAIIPHKASGMNRYDPISNDQSLINGISLIIMVVCVIGCTGYLGSKISSRLHSQGHKVIGVCRKFPKK